MYIDIQDEKHIWLEGKTGLLQSKIVFTFNYNVLSLYHNDTCVIQYLFTNGAQQ